MTTPDTFNRAEHPDYDNILGLANLFELCEDKMYAEHGDKRRIMDLFLAELKRVIRKPNDVYDTSPKGLRLIEVMRAFLNDDFEFLRAYSEDEICGDVVAGYVGNLDRLNSPEYAAHRDAIKDFLAMSKRNAELGE